jgi:RNA polymerase sigma-70 factor, ECF subfamily
MDDTEICRRLKAGDEEAFDLIVSRMQKSLAAVAYAIVGNSATADEIVQETWLSVIENLDGFEGRASLRNWIFTILTNKAKTRVRREARNVPLFDAELNHDNEPAVSPDRFTPDGDWKTQPPHFDEITPERIVAGRQMLAHINDAIQALPPAQKAVLLMLEDAGMKPGDAAERLGISLAHLRVLLHRARARLRTVIEQLTT